GLLNATCRGDDELICGEHELRLHPRERNLLRRFHKPRAATTLRLQELRWRQRTDRLPRFSRGNQCSRRVGRQRQPEVPRTPEIAAALITTVLLQFVDQRGEQFGNDGERFVVPMDKQPERRKI